MSGHRSISIMAVPSQKPFAFCQAPLIVCCDEHHGQKHVGEERVYFRSWSTVSYWGKPGQKLNAGTQRQELMQRPWRWCYLPQCPSPSVNCHKNAPDLPTGQSDGNIFSVEVLYSQMSLTCVKLIKNKQTNKQHLHFSIYVYVLLWGHSPQEFQK